MYWPDCIEKTSRCLLQDTAAKYKCSKISLVGLTNWRPNKSFYSHFEFFHFKNQMPFLLLWKCSYINFCSEKSVVQKIHFHRNNLFLLFTIKYLDTNKNLYRLTAISQWNTSSCPITEVKQHWTWSVLREWLFRNTKCCKPLPTPIVPVL